MYTEIQSLDEFFKKIKDYKNNDDKYKIYYRGHSNCEWGLTPSIYRGKGCMIQQEDKIYREMISKTPHSFEGKSTIDSLSLMQHYGVPTRLLDITTNPLVALYFTCCENKNKDGEVIILNVPNDKICHYNSDRVTAVANIAKCDNTFRYKKGRIYDFKGMIKILKKKYDEETNDYNLTDESFKTHEKKIEKSIKDIRERSFFVEEYKDIEKNIEDYCNSNKLENQVERNQVKGIFIRKYIDHYKKDIGKEIEKKNHEYFGYLLHNIREDKPYFQPIINPDDIDNVFAVEPKMDNPRITRQYGAFLLFGVMPGALTDFFPEEDEIKDKKKMATLENSGITYKKILIKKQYKKVLLEELDHLGINKGTLFPEIDKVAEYIIEKYKKISKICVPPTQIQESIKQIQESIKQIQNATEQIQNTTEQIQNATEQIQNTTEQIQNATEQIQNATEQIQDTTEQIQNATEQIQKNTTQI